MSTKHPKVFSTHVKDLCKVLESEAPTLSSPNPPGAVEDLKACVGFVKKFPNELPLNTKENRKLLQSLLSFAQFGSPPKAAKHAITIIMSSDNKKELHAQDLLAKSIKSFEYGSNHFLTKLATLSQLVLLAPGTCEDDADKIVDIAVNGVLLEAHVTSQEAEQEWMETLDDDMVARIWALRILVNRLRSFSAEADIIEVAKPIYLLLNRMVREGGEVSKTKDTALGHKNLQRLNAAHLLLKLSTVRRLDGLLTPKDFNELALVTHDACFQVRKGFAIKLMKYLGQGRLPSRFYTILFYCAYEPDGNLQESIMTWLRSRRSAFMLRKETILETAFARLLSLLAHYPDFGTDADTLKVMAKYVLFYLKCIATQDNLSLIYHVAQRVKGVADGVAPSDAADERMYILSDLAQALIRSWEEQNGWTMQSWPGKLKLPAGIYKALESHQRAQEVADKVWIDAELIEELDPLVRSALRSKKRKAAEGGEKSRKKAKSDRGVKKEKAKADRPIKTPRKKKRKSDESKDGSHALASSEPQRKSDRRSGISKSYIEIDSDIDEADAEVGVGEEDEEEESQKGTATTEQESDVEMVDPEEEPGVEAAAEASSEPEEEAEPEPEPEPEPPKPSKRVAKGSTVKKTNSVASSSPRQEEEKSARSRKTSTPVKAPTPAKASKGRAKEVNTVASSTTNGNVRRSARSRG
jgi:sister-chromatid-cohesion protein PDS5